MQGQGRKGASGRGDGLGVRRSRSVPEKPSASLGGVAQGAKRRRRGVFFIEQWGKLWNDDNDSRHKTEAE